jgi:sigma-B regulation protein RsbQ
MTSGFRVSEEILRRNNVKVSGRGARPTPFARGFGCDLNRWRFVAPAFAWTGC